jgi:ABC-type oligopeptide transport system ATPase subunit
MSCPGPDARHYRAPARYPILDRMQSAIEIEGLRKAYGDVEAVRDISFSVTAGEVFCLLGPNGAGKTTTTEILEGYRARSAGEVRVLGHDPEDGDRALRERVGIVLQEAAAQAELTVAEVLTMYGRYYPRRRPAGELVELEGARTALDAAGIEATIDRPQVALPPDVEAVLAWTVREAATNVIRHSGARHSAIRLVPALGEATVEVVDDGEGAPGAGATNGAGHGLAGLDVRVRQAGERLEAGPRDDGPGFRVRAVVPVESRR